jgi:hypothetical protein
LREEAGLDRRELNLEVVQRGPDGQPIAFGAFSSGEYFLRFPRRVTYAFDGDGAEMRYGASAESTQEIVDDLFLSTALPMMLHVQGHEALHASAVLLDDKVVAFCGASGAGKTTLALALTQRGHEAWADDVLVVSPEESGEGSVCSIRLPYAVNPRSETEHFLGTGEGAWFKSAADLPERSSVGAAFILDRAAYPTPSIRRLPLDEAIAAVLPHGFCFLAEPGRAQRTAAAYLDLLTRVPVYRFSYPTGFDVLADVLDELESRVRLSFEEQSAVELT